MRTRFFTDYKEAQQRVRDRDFDWNAWFAWYPVRTMDGSTVWLEWSETRFQLYHRFNGTVADTSVIVKYIETGFSSNAYLKLWQYRTRSASNGQEQ